MPPQRAITLINLRFYVAAAALLAAPFLASTQPTAEPLVAETTVMAPSNVIYGYAPDTTACQTAVKLEQVRIQVEASTAGVPPI